MILPARGSLRLLAVPLVLGLALGGLSGCTDDDKGGKGDGPDPRAALEAAKKVLDETSGVTIELSTKDLPNGVTGITSAQGTGVHPSASAGSPLTPT